jgi:hypothetical protein
VPALEEQPAYVGDPEVGKTAIAEGLPAASFTRSAGSVAQRDDLCPRHERYWPARAIAAISKSG